MKFRILSKDDIKAVVDMDKVMETVENVYKRKAQGETVVWPTVFYEWERGYHDMDIKSGYIKGDELHGLKCINYNERNLEKGLPSLVGLIMVLILKRACRSDSSTEALSQVSERDVQAL